MELTNEFSVPVPLERAWEVLNDVELIAPCMPGAQLEEIEGDEYRGTVKVKVGPITAQYKGAAVFTERDQANGRIVIDASGRDTRGQGSASAIITLTMVAVGDRTDVTVNSDVTIKGKVAQFGRGMIADVAGNLLTQFVECLEGKLDAAPMQPAPEAATATEAATAPEGGAEPSAAQAPPTVRKVDSAPAEAVDLLGTAGAPVAKRLIPVAVLLIVLILLGRARSRRRRRS